MAKAVVASAESWVDQPFAFSSENSIDPDESPQPLTFLWEFGDGAVATNANPSHTFAEPRAYRVSLTVSDGRDATIDSIVVHALARTTPLPPSASSLLALRKTSSELWVVNPDSHSVSVVGLANDPPSKVAEMFTGLNPRTVAFSPRALTHRFLTSLSAWLRALRVRWAPTKLHPKTDASAPMFRPTFKTGISAGL